MHRILIVEDERDIADLIGFNLQRAGYQIIKAHDGLEGTYLALRERPDLILLDLMLPGRDGYAVFQKLRRDQRTAHTPVIILTASVRAEDRIRGLEAGADDYLTTPFSPKELMLRVQAVLKRSDVAPVTVTFSYGPFRFDGKSLKFYLNNEPTELTSTEFKLLLFLCERPGKTHHREDLLRSIWGYAEATQSRTVDTHMKRLRKKLGPHANIVRTVRGIGYCVAEVTTMSSNWIIA
jgi:two-component system phosphate regulon response regulator PhoB